MDRFDRAMTAFGWIVVALAIGYFAAHLAIAYLKGTLP